MTDDASAELSAHPSDAQASHWSLGPPPVVADFSGRRSVSGRAGVAARQRALLTDADVSRAIESAVIPRLLVAHRAASRLKDVAQDRHTVGRDDIASLVALAIHQPLPVVLEFVDGLRARGISAEAVVGDVLPAAARHVGWLWETDACSFVDVTFALSRFQQLLHDHARDLSVDTMATPCGRRFLLSTMPGEQHTFGIGVAEAFLRKAAWDVVPYVPKASRDILRYVAETAFDIVGLSASNDRHIAEMPGLAAKIRKRSVNPEIRIVAAGPAIVRRPKQAAEIGADLVIVDLANGMRQMEDLVGSVQATR